MSRVASLSLSKVLPFREPREDATVRFVCLPFAGGSAAVFRDWGRLLPAHVDTCAVELAGRGARAGEKLADDIDSVAQEIVDALRPLMDRPAVLFGHSLGARLAFLMAQREPRYRMLIASAARSPELPPRVSRATLPERALIAEIGRMGGTPPEVLAEADLMALFLPLLRADFGLNERHVAAFDGTIGIPIVAVGARDDREVSSEEVRGWERRTTASFRRIELDGGGHFFLKSRRDAVLEHVRALL